MSRHGLHEDLDDNWLFIKYRGQVASALRGKSGQKFLKDLVRALDALPEQKLISQSLQEQDGAVCAMGAVGRLRGIDMSKFTIGPDDDPEDFAYDQLYELSGMFDIAHQLVSEVIWENDEQCYNKTDHHRWLWMRKWADSRIIKLKKRSKPWAYWEAAW
jgi:hypothetical protein